MITSEQLTSYQVIFSLPKTDIPLESRSKYSELYTGRNTLFYLGNKSNKVSIYARFRRLNGLTDKSNFSMAVF